MLEIFICEDEQFQRNVFAKCVSDYILIENLDMRLALSTGSPDEIIEYISANKPAGLYFLDVDLQCEITGIQLAEKIRRHDPRGFIVFITSYSETLPLTFKYKVEAMDFIIKDDLDINPRICECVKNAFEKYSAKTSPLQNNFTFKVLDNKYISVESAKIIYFETSVTAAHKIILHAEDKIYNFYGNLKQIEKLLDKNFLRCHNSFIANLARVREYDVKEKKLVFDNGYTCEISVRSVKKVNDYLKKNRRG